MSFLDDFRFQSFGKETYVFNPETQKYDLKEFKWIKSYFKHKDDSEWTEIKEDV